MKSEDLYRRLPIALQNLACNFYGLRERQTRFGSHFSQQFQNLISSDWASKSEIEAYQDAQVASLVDHAYKTVPYYRRVMDEHGLKPKDILSRAELVKLPILRKEDVVKFFQDLLSTEYKKKELRVFTTSGTTGKALKFLKNQEAIASQWAVWWRHRHRFGIEPFTWHVNFTGKPIVPIDQTKPPFWRWNFPLRQVLINMQHITAPKIKHIGNFIGNHNFKYFSGYPSIIANYCQLLLEQRIFVKQTPSHIFLGAEPVLEDQRSIIEQTTGAVITDQYGFSEGAGNASRCEQGIYHEDWEFGILECADAEPIGNGQVRGRILATGFANRAFPFLRYEVGDIGIWEDNGYQCKCGRHSAVLKQIEGRTEDYVLTPEGNRIMRFDYLFKDTIGIKEAQVVQREHGQIIIRVVARTSFNQEDAEGIKQKVKQWISPALMVDFEVVNSIPRSNSGKFRPVLSELKEIHSNKSH